MPEKLPFFLDFANSCLPLKNYPFFRESGYERGIPDNIAEAGRLRLPGGTYGSLRQSIAAAHSEAGRRRLCQIKNAHATAWWREADAGWLPACRCRPGAGSTGCAGLNAAHGVTTGCQRRPASGCADVDRDWDDRAVYGGEHALPTDVTIGTADPGLSEWRKVTCGAFSGFPTNFGSLSHQLSPSCREPSLTCTAQLTGIGGSSFLSRKCASSSVFIFVYTIHRWVKSKHCTRSCGLMILKCWLALSSGGSTGPQPTAIQHVVKTVMVHDSENDNWYVHGHIENFWGIASPDDQHIIYSVQNSVKKVVSPPALNLKS